MKKNLLLASCFVSSFLFSQITMLPAGTHYYDPYQATVSGNGTIYYTTDGSTPTLNSNSAIFECNKGMKESADSLIPLKMNSNI